MEEEKPNYRQKEEFQENVMTWQLKEESSLRRRDCKTESNMANNSSDKIEGKCPLDLAM